MLSKKLFSLLFLVEIVGIFLLVAGIFGCGSEEAGSNDIVAPAESPWSSSVIGKEVAAYVDSGQQAVYVLQKNGSRISIPNLLVSSALVFSPAFEDRIDDVINVDRVAEDDFTASVVLYENFDYLYDSSDGHYHHEAVSVCLIVSAPNSHDGAGAVHFFVYKVGADEWLEVVDFRMKGTYSGQNLGKSMVLNHGDCIISDAGETEYSVYLGGIKDHNSSPGNNPWAYTEVAELFEVNSPEDLPPPPVLPSFDFDEDELDVNVVVVDEINPEDAEQEGEFEKLFDVIEELLELIEELEEEDD